MDRDRVGREEREYKANVAKRLADLRARYSAIDRNNPQLQQNVSSVQQPSASAVPGERCHLSELEDDGKMAESVSFDKTCAAVPVFRSYIAPSGTLNRGSASPAIRKAPDRSEFTVPVIPSNIASSGTLFAAPAISKAPYPCYFADEERRKRSYYQTLSYLPQALQSHFQRLSYLPQALQPKPQINVPPMQQPAESEPDESGSESDSDSESDSESGSDSESEESDSESEEEEAQVKETPQLEISVTTSNDKKEAECNVSEAQEAPEEAQVNETPQLEIVGEDYNLSESDSEAEVNEIPQLGIIVEDYNLSEPEEETLQLKMQPFTSTYAQPGSKSNAPVKGLDGPERRLAEPQKSPASPKKAKVKYEELERRAGEPQKAPASPKKKAKYEELEKRAAEPQKAPASPRRNAKFEEPRERRPAQPQKPPALPKKNAKYEEPPRETRPAEPQKAPASPKKKAKYEELGKAVVTSNDKSEEGCRCKKHEPPSIDTVIESAQKKLKVKLMKHQDIAVRWMLGQERSDVNGGILADDQGLGKTISTITLMLAGCFRHPEGSECPKHGKMKAGTLIVCPKSLLRQWKKELETKVNPWARRTGVNQVNKGIQVLVYHENRNKYTLDAMRKYDVVLTTYNVVAMEVPPPKREWVTRNDFGTLTRDKGKVLKYFKKHFEANTSIGPLGMLEWYRVVLDEAQTIKNASTGLSMSCRDLKAKKRWGLTGTPLQNAVGDLYSYTRFLRFKPYHEANVFVSNILGPIRHKHDYRVAHDLVKQMILRRTKNDKIEGEPLVKLPERIVQLVELKFTQEEQDIYDEISDLVNLRLKAIKEEGKLGVRMHKILAMITKLRQLCNHPVLAYIKKSSKTPKRKRKRDEEEYDEESQEEEDEETKFMNAEEEDEETKFASNFDRNNFDMEDLIPKERAEKAASAKINALLELTAKIPKDEKILVFSQWTSFLDMVEPKLNEAGLVYTRLDGTMTSSRRDNAVEEFTHNPETRMMLCSLHAASLGLNLVAASRVILMDLWWNPALEDQAIDRAHRIGQGRPVHVYKYTMVGTIEERLLEILKSKNKMISEVIGGTRSGEIKTDFKSIIKDLISSL